MNKTTGLLLTGLASVLHIHADAPKNIENLKIRTVNIVELMRDSQEGVKVTAELEAMRSQLTQELKAAEEDYVKQATAYQDKEKAKALTAEAREKEQVRLMDKRRDVESKGQKAEDKLKYTMQAETERLGQKAQTVIAAHAKENGLDIVFDTASGRALWSSQKTDVTKQMVASMNENYKIELAQAGKKETTKVASASAKADSKAAA
jgi:Skp family chaperone for outer membrane proteins